MKGIDDPKVFSYSSRVRSFKRGFIIAAICGITYEFLVWWFSNGANERLLLIGLSALGATAVLFSFRGPVAVLSRNYVQLPGYFGYSLIEIPYSQIVALQKIPQNRLTVLYRTNTKIRKAHLPLRWIIDTEDLEARLCTGTSLEIQIYKPWWYRPFIVLDSLVPVEELYSWRFAVYTLAAGLVVGALLLLFAWLGWMPPTWLLFGVLITTGFATQFYFLRRYRKRRNLKDR